MVGQHVEIGCAQKATLWASADYAQGDDTFSTPKIAPATPMQAWKKPAHRQESPDTLPSLAWGKDSVETKAAYVNSNMTHTMPMPSGPGSSSMTSRIHSGMEPKETLLSVSLSQYEKSFSLATPLRNHVGPSSSHRVCAPAGDSLMPPAGNAVFYHEDQTIASDESILHGSIQSGRSDPVTAERTCTSENSTLPYLNAPGEIANDAYKLYSELFPSTVATPNGNLLAPRSGYVNPVPCAGQPDSKKLPLSEACGRKSSAQARPVHNKDPLGGRKKLKLSTNEEVASSKSFLVVKEEPVFEEPYGMHELSSCGEAFSTRVPLSKWRDDLGSCRQNMQRDFSVSTPLRAHSPLTASQALGDCSVDVKPATGSFKFSATSEEIFLPASSFGLQAGDSSRPIVPKIGAWESHVENSPSAESDWGKFLALSATPLNKKDTALMLPFQRRFEALQAFLKECDEADQNERLQRLRALPAASRSGYAVELETRAIQMSLEEGRELQRMRLLNVLGRASENALEELGGTPHGPKLPVLGAALPLEHAS